LRSYTLSRFWGKRPLTLPYQPHFHTNKKIGYVIKKGNSR
jgi:hypothetical protein